MKKIHLRSLALTRRVHLYPTFEISVLMDISVLAFYGYIGYISGYFFMNIDIPKLKKIRCNS